MADVTVKYKDSTIAEMSNGNGTKTLKTRGCYCEGDIKVDYTPRIKTYDITLAKAYGWLLLTTLDEEVLEHINDESFTVSLINTSAYETVTYSGAMYFCGNRFLGKNGTYDVYGTGHREFSTGNSFNMICAPANSTSSTLVTSSAFGQFRLDGNKYYLQPGDGYVKVGNYRLTFTW